MVVPLLTPDPTHLPPLPQPPAGSKWSIFYALRGTTILGVWLAGLGTVGFIFYLNTDKEHKPETALLWVSVIFVAAGFHFMSRQSVKSFLADFGRFIPWGKKNGTSEQPARPGGNQ